MANVNCSSDSCIWYDGKTYGFENTTLLKTGGTNSYRSILRFDLSGYTNITDAKLWLYYTLNTNDTYVYPTTNELDPENSANTTTLYTGIGSYINFIAGGTAGWKSFNLTSYAQTHQNGICQIALWSSVAAQNTIHSSEGTYVPYLEITEGSAAETKTLTFTNDFSVNVPITKTFTNDFNVSVAGKTDTFTNDFYVIIPIKTFTNDFQVNIDGQTLEFENDFIVAPPSSLLFENDFMVWEFTETESAKIILRFDNDEVSQSSWANPITTGITNQSGESVTTFTAICTQAGFHKDNCTLTLSGDNADYFMLSTSETFGSTWGNSIDIGTVDDEGTTVYLKSRAQSAGIGEYINAQIAMNNEVEAD